MGRSTSEAEPHAQVATYSPYGHYAVRYVHASVDTAFRLTFPGTAQISEWEGYHMPCLPRREAFAEG